MILTRLIHYGLILIDKISFCLFYLAIGLVALYAFPAPVVLIGKLTGGVSWTELGKYLLPHVVGFGLMALLKYIQWEISQATKLTSIAYTGKKEALRQVYNLEGKASSASARIKKLETQETELNKRLETLKTQINEDHQKHMKWLNVDVIQERKEQEQKLKAYIDHLAVQYSGDKLKERIAQEQEDNFLDFSKKKKNGTFH